MRIKISTFASTVAHALILSRGFIEKDGPLAILSLSCLVIIVLDTLISGEE